MSSVLICMGFYVLRFGPAQPVAPHFGTVTSVEWCTPFSPQDILFTLAGKERKIAGYRLRADEIWLLIICDFMANGLFIDPPEEPVQFRINSDFDRLFCLAWTGNYAVEFPR